eukprot:CAMPEP_0194302952 /NCGR_PEP_ID=MMETSP0171-20130528/840_1 /TAXON_ID=218684 /ORGANISM="Corethron pennatum, Strain L29A3" /LENGTH=74 /DNA_ID=CAMNT_0039053641 /DNA_START=444 /DNA_END=668 /DNA_ORIENTATION=-
MALTPRKVSSARFYQTARKEDAYGSTFFLAETEKIVISNSASKRNLYSRTTMIAIIRDAPSVPQFAQAFIETLN